MEHRDRWLVAWAIGYAAVGTASLLVPLFAIRLGAGALFVGIIASTAAFAGVPGALLWGWLAERTGRRRGFILLALVATAIVLAVMPSIDSVWVLVGANAVLWFVVAAAAPVLTLLVVEGTNESGWEDRIAILNAYQGYGWVAGLVFGAVWTPLGSWVFTPQMAQDSLFWLCALGAGVASVFAVRWLPRERPAESPSVVARPALLARLDRGGARYVRTVPVVSTRLYWGLRSLPRHGLRTTLSRRMWVYMVVVMVFSAGFAAFWGPLPVYLRDRFVDQAVYWLFLTSNLAAAVSYRSAGRWARNGRSAALQAQALAARVVLFPSVSLGIVVLPVVFEFPVLLVVFSFIGITWAVIAVTATGLVTRHGRTSRGQALGVYTAVTGIGGGVGSVIGGWLGGQFGFVVAFSVAGGMVLVSLVGLLVIRIGRPS